MNQKQALSKLQKIELEILLVVASFCKEHSITWALDSGTALGAARHGGFIPWDDDIDISMPRGEYERFAELAQISFPEGYSFHCFDNTEGFSGFIGKVYKEGTKFETAETRSSGCGQGIFIDIIPFDTVSTDLGTQDRQLKNAAQWQRKSYLYHSGVVAVPHKGFLGVVERAACQCAHLFLRVATKNRDVFKTQYEKSIFKKNPENGDCITNMTFCPNGHVPFEKMYPAKPIMFEGYELCGPRDIEGYLSLMYGDWRKIPEPENRHTHLPLLIDFGDGTVWEAK